MTHRAPSSSSPSGVVQTRWWCECDCGQIVNALSTKLRRGLKQHCGCVQRAKVLANCGLLSGDAKHRRVARVKRYAEKHRERLRDYNKQYRDTNKTTINAQRRNYLVLHTQEILAKRRASPHARMRCALQARIRHAVINTRTKKIDKTLALVGCSLAFLESHLSKQFTDGMSWENYGRWHIDHIKPCASFDLSDPAQQRACFHYTNLQPLWAAENIGKGCRIEVALIQVQ